MSITSVGMSCSVAPVGGPESALVASEEVNITRSKADVD